MFFFPRFNVFADGFFVVLSFSYLLLAFIFSAAHVSFVIPKKKDRKKQNYCCISCLCVFFLVFCLAVPDKQERPRLVRAVRLPGGSRAVLPGSGAGGLRRQPRLLHLRHRLQGQKKANNLAIFQKAFRAKHCSLCLRVL